MMTITFEQLVEATEPAKFNVSGARTWITNQVENTDRPHDEIKKDFLKKYPNQSTFFDKVVSELVD